jgi:hypothetical protein
MKAKTNHNAFRLKQARDQPLFGRTPATRCLDEAAAGHSMVIVAETCGGQRELLKEMESSVRQVVDARLIAFGLDEEDQKDLQADLRHLRGLRKRAEQIHSLILRRPLPA